MLLCLARLSPVKGIDKIIPILAKTNCANKITLLIAGDGELKNKIINIVVEEKIDVRLLGFQEQQSVVELYSIADVFILPSMSDPNPLTCIEALWAGLPLFISEHCGNYPEVVKQGCNGFVFSYNDINGIVNSLNQLINYSKENYLKARETSLQIANEHYNSKKIVKEIIDHCHACMY